MLCVLLRAAAAAAVMVDQLDFAYMRRTRSVQPAPSRRSPGCISGAWRLFLQPPADPGSSSRSVLHTCAPFSTCCSASLPAASIRCSIWCSLAFRPVSAPFTTRTETVLQLVFLSSVSSRGFSVLNLSLLQLEATARASTVAMRESEGCYRGNR